MLIKRNNQFKILSGEQIRSKYSHLNLLNRNTFFLSFKNSLKLSNLVPIDIETANFLYNISGRKFIDINKYDHLNIHLESLVFDDIIKLKAEKSMTIDCKINGSSFDTTEITKFQSNKIEELSSGAIQYAWQFRELSVDAIVQKLYSFNTMPLDFDFLNKIKSTEEIKNWLNIGENKILSNTYIEIPNSAENKYWIYWQHKNLRSSKLNYKIYISPKPNDLPEVFDRIINQSRKTFVSSFKIGATPNGILRPDKMVLYFSDAKEIYNFNRETSSWLSEFGAQGVPFTFSLNKNGIISCAKEPNLGYTTSWRFHICNIIANTIKLHSFHSETINSETVVNKLKLLGFEVNNWEPNTNNIS